MPFQPGNQEAKKANHKRPKIFTDALIDVLGEELKVAGADVSKLRLIARRLVDEGMDGNVQAIKEIADRVEGKVAQIVTGEDGGPLVDLPNPSDLASAIADVLKTAR